MSSIETIEIGVGGGLNFTARAAGPSDGRLVLLLHGFPETSRSWVHQLEALGRAGYRAIAPDQRGYSAGARPEGVDAYRMDHLVADVLAVADVAGGEQFDLVGHDWGGAVAWALASAHPDRLRTLTAVSTPHPMAFAAVLGQGEGDQASRSSYIEFFRDPSSTDGMLAHDGQGLRLLFVGSGLADDDAVAEYMAVLTQPGALDAALNWYRAVDLTAMSGIGPIEVPTMYVWSTEDVALGREAAEATEQFVSGPYRFEVLDGVSHWIPEAAAEAFTALLLAHLDAH
ncbi:MAG: alpha/beta fold hydrolase [Acidimicrobiales bacterium]